MTRHDDSSHSTERIPVHDPAGFAPDVSPDEWAAAVRAARIKLRPIWNQPFEVLQPVASRRPGSHQHDTSRSHGRPDGCAAAAISAPFATFDMQRPQYGRAAVTHHFQANGYGSTGIGTFIFSFTVQTPGEETSSPSVRHAGRHAYRAGQCGHPQFLADLHDHRHHRQPPRRRRGVDLSEADERGAVAMVPDGGARAATGIGPDYQPRLSAAGVPPSEGGDRRRRGVHATNHRGRARSSAIDFVRFGSKADICAAKSHHRFTPKNGHVQCNSACPLCAR